MNLPAKRQRKWQGWVYIKKMTSCRHRSVGETGGSRHPQNKEESKSPNKNGRQDFVQDCNFCGRTHECKKTSCTAWGKVCRKCNGRNHFQLKCRKMHAVSVESVDKQSDMKPQFLLAVTSHNVGRVTAPTRIDEYDVPF